MIHSFSVVFTNGDTSSPGVLSQHRRPHAEAARYYANPKRGAIPEWKNEMSVMTWLYWLTFDGLSAAASVTTPTLIVHSNGCALSDNAKAVHARLAGKKQLVWMENGTQTDFYDVPEYVNTAAAHADARFKETL
jgi:fermentation-respiration switch protein FrsA (DUF1100 family)